MIYNYNDNYNNFRVNACSDPKILAQHPYPVCQSCSRKGHSQRTCSVKPPSDTEAMSREDQLFWSLVNKKD